MEKLLKKVVSIVCAIALAVTGIVFTPSNVSADIQNVPNSVETKVGAWGLYAANEGWAGYSEMQYDYTSGSAIENTKIILKNSPYGNYNQVSWGTYARLANYLPTMNLKADETYRLKITVDISGNNTETNEQNGKGYMLANIQGKVYKFNINKTGNNQSFETTTTFDYDALAGETATPSKDPNDIYFYLAGLNSGTEITFKEVTARVDNDGWTPVQNWNPDDAQPGESAPYQTAGKLKVLAMYGPKSGMWAKLKTKKRPDAASEETVYDTMVKVTSAGWVDNSTEERSWAGSIRLEDYCDKTAGLVTGEEYKGTIKIHSSKDTINDTHGRENKLMVVVDGKSFYTSLEANKTATIDLGQFEYTGQSSIDINLDGLDKDTELYIEEIKFEDQTGSGWTAVPNEGTTTSDQTGAWELFARTCTGIGDDNSQWGALSYKNAPGVTTPQNMQDTIIKVRSSSGWHNAWATLGTLHGYIAKDPNKLKVGHKYLTKVTYYSNKKTGKDKFGKDKTLLLSVDKAQVLMPLEACNDDGTYSDTKTYTTPSKDGFVYEKEQTENDPLAVVLNMDQLDKGTELRIMNIEFIEDPSYEWTAVPNNEYTQAGNTWMNCYARTEEDVSAGSWGKMSYKIEGDDTDYRNVTVLNRSTSGWFVTNNPANVVEFQNITDENHLGLKKGYTYTGKIVVSSTLTDPEAIAKGDHNVIKVVKDADEMEKVKEITLNDNGDTVIDIPEFVFTEKTKDVKFILDMMTKNSEFKVKSIEFTHKPGEPDYESVPNDTAVQTGAWWLYALSGQDGAWGEMMYAQGSGSEMGDTTIYCFNTSGWFPGNAGMLATLSDYCDGKMTVGQKYSVAITLDTDKAIAGVDEGGVQHNVRVTINDQNYDFEAYEGEHTYVIPCTSEPYSLTASQDVVFNLDTAPAQTKVTIKEVKFGNPINDPEPIKTLNGTVNTDKTVKVDWEQVENTYYGTLATPCGYNVYVDGNKVNSELVKNNVRTYTTAALSTGKHKIKVVPTIGATLGTGKEIEVVVGDKPTETVTQAPTETQGPTAKPTAAPATTKAPTVKKPGKATVKKAVKKKKSAKKIKVTLKKVAGATKYQVAVYKTKKNAKKNKKALVKKTVTKLTVTIKSKKLKGKKTVYVRARAWNVAGYGAWSGVKKSKKK